MMRKYPDYCIWDFNGTILNDVETGIEAVNTLLAERNLPVIAHADFYREVFRFPIRDYYRKLGFDFDKEPYEAIAPLWVEQYLKRVPQAELYEDVRWLLEQFRTLGIRQTVLSATEQNMLLAQLHSLGIDGYFEEILGLDNIHAGSKLSLAEDWRRRHPEATAIFLGDTDHDAETAQRLRGDCFLIAGGHQSEAHLRTVGVPVFLSLRAFYRSVFDPEI